MADDCMHCGANKPDCRRRIPRGRNSRGELFGATAIELPLCDECAQTLVARHGLTYEPDDPEDPLVEVAIRALREQGWL